MITFRAKKAYLTQHRDHRGTQSFTE